MAPSATSPLLAHRTSPRTRSEAQTISFSWWSFVHVLALVWIGFMVVHTLSASSRKEQAAGGSLDEVAQRLFADPSGSGAVSTSGSRAAR